MSHHRTARLRLACAASALASVFSTQLAFASPVDVSFVAYAIEKDGLGLETFVPVSTVMPGQLIEYRVSYENVSEAPLQKFVIKGDIPQPSKFVPGSGLSATNSQLEAYVDGFGWSSVPVKRQTRQPDGRVTTIEFPAHTYEAVRWKLTGALNPGEKVGALYRVRYD